VEGDMSEPNERQYWLWVARPDVYLDEDGNDREDLDPDSGVDSDGWWTCHKDTTKGDLVFLWRTSPKKDIGYLIQAESDAYSIADDNDRGWEYGCDHQMLYKFNHPINVKDLRNDPYFDEWGPLRCSFQRSSFEISKNYWDKLNQLAAAKNPGYLDFIELIQKEPISEGILLEEQLEEMLATNLKILKNFGHDLEIYVDPASKQSGRQFICKGNGGRIDLLCCDRTQKKYVVIELKNVRAGQNTFGQISNYVGWVQNRIAGAGDVPVIGIVISRGYDTKFESALKITDRISHINVEDLGFAIAPSKRPQRFIEPEQKESIKDASKLGIRSAKSREAYRWLKKGNELSDQAKYDEAIACYDKVIEINPKNKWGWINKGAALDDLGKYEEAIKTYDKAIEIHPESADIWCNKGFSLDNMGKHGDAMVAFNKAIEIKSKFAAAWNGRGIALANMERYEEAIEAYNKAIAIRPKFTFAWNNKGLALANQGKSEEAIKAFDKAIELDPKDAYAWNNKGTALADMEKYDEAIQVYDKAIQINPQDALYWSNKGNALYNKGEYEEAIKTLDKAIEIDPQAATAWANKGYTLGQLGEYEEAIKAYDESIRLNPQYADAWNLKGYAFYKEGKYNEAIEASDKALGLDPDHEGAWSNKGNALYDRSL
jgi:tetratricopeptide (TPR) repeat protein